MILQAAHSYRICWLLAHASTTNSSDPNDPADHAQPLPLLRRALVPLCGRRRRRRASRRPPGSVAPGGAPCRLCPGRAPRRCKTLAWRHCRSRSRCRPRRGAPAIAPWGSSSGNHACAPWTPSNEQLAHGLFLSCVVISYRYLYYRDHVDQRRDRDIIYSNDVVCISLCILEGSAFVFLTAQAISIPYSRLVHRIFNSTRCLFFKDVGTPLTSCFICTGVHR